MDRDSIQELLFKEDNIQTQQSSGESDKSLDFHIKLKKIEQEILKILIKEGFEQPKIITPLAMFIDNLTRAK